MKYLILYPKEVSVIINFAYFDSECSNLLSLHSSGHSIRSCVTSQIRVKADSCLWLWESDSVHCQYSNDQSALGCPAKNVICRNLRKYNFLSFFPSLIRNVQSVSFYPSPCGSVTAANVLLIYSMCKCFRPSTLSGI